jgi:hypothetical protein
VHIVITTLGIDLKTPGGRLVFGMMVQIADYAESVVMQSPVAGLQVGLPFGGAALRIIRTKGGLLHRRCATIAAARENRTWPLSETGGPK